jgi:hypothetical protein
MNEPGKNANSSAHSCISTSVKPPEEVDQMKSKLFQLNAGTGMALGAIVAAIIALVVQLITHESSVWTWAVPVGIAVGLAIGAGASTRTSATDRKRRDSNA